MTIHTPAGTPDNGLAEAHREFEAFYNDCQPRIMRYAASLTGNHCNAEELVQEVFAKAWQHWSGIRGHRSPEAWVRTVLFRTWVTWWRKDAAQTRAHRRHGMPADVPEPAIDHVLIVSAMRAIPASQREAILLHHGQGMSVKQVATVSSTPVSSVKARLVRGRRSLAELLRDENTR
ncbi:SigE family RNA polymerase sigma factor [Catenulispora subtropica]|uniref:SigE family RNA polymerase sigma factor n=1 Tax=Catenulispora subtropica TaxID=450798 RepID=A0ABP5CNH3_9ACTN